MTIFVAEVLGDSGLPFEDEAIAAIEGDDFEEARDFLVAAVMAMNRLLFLTGAERWDEGSPINTREASAGETAVYHQRKASHRDAASPVVWLINIETL
jgi:hypothetical protein